MDGPADRRWFHITAHMYGSWLYGDPRGFRPLSIGKLNGSYVVASETCAFDLINAVHLRDVEPGEMVILDGRGITSLRFTPPVPHAQCIFEHVYFSRPDSVVFGRSVQESRDMLGRMLARELFSGLWLASRSEGPSLLRNRPRSIRLAEDDMCVHF